MCVFVCAGACPLLSIVCILCVIEHCFVRPCMRRLLLHGPLVCIFSTSCRKSFCPCRDNSGMSARAVYDVALAHSKLKLRCKLVISIIGCLANLVDIAKAANAKPEPSLSRSRRDSRSDFAVCVPAFCDNQLLPSTEHTNVTPSNRVALSCLCSLSFALSCAPTSVRSKSSVTESESGKDGGAGGVGTPDSNAADSIPPEVLELAELRGPKYAEVTLEARQMLIVQQGLSIQQKLASIESLLRSVARMQSSSSSASSCDSSSPDTTGACFVCVCGCICVFVVLRLVGQVAFVCGSCFVFRGVCVCLCESASGVCFRDAHSIFAALR
jgi:hypothetical protein